MFDNEQNEIDLELAIARAFEELANHAVESDEYKKIVERLNQLYTLQKTTAEFNLQKRRATHEARVADADYDLRHIDSMRQDKIAEADCAVKRLEAEEKKTLLKRRWPVSADTTAIIAANLIGIAVVVGYERAHVLTSKAMGFILKAK